MQLGTQLCTFCKGACGGWCGVREEVEVGDGKLRFIPGGMFQKREKNFKNRVPW